MIPAELILTETKHWLVNHRMSSTYPGYLMVESKQKATEMGQLSTESLTEIGPLLASMEGVIVRTYSPQKILIAKLGFTLNVNCHFHLVPVHSWVIRAISEHSSYSNDPDGNDVMQYVNREYCDNQNENDALRVALKSIAELKLQVRSCKALQSD